MAEKTILATAEMTQPVIIDLGRQRARSLRDLKNGEGKLWDEVLDVADEVKEMLGADAEGKVLVPIIMLYQQKSGRLNLGNVIFPLLDDEDDDDDDDEDEEE
ncbi:MAG: hypothetical protein L6461_18810 [Anaerolineae bacterium]|nr:hypothetical protein [Anaerolineae bacterium]